MKYKIYVKYETVVEAEDDIEAEDEGLHQFRKDSKTTEFSDYFDLKVEPLPEED